MRQERLRYAIRAMVLLLLSGWALPACNEEQFLSVYNPKEVSDVDFPQSLQDVRSLLTAAYGSLHDYSFLGSYWSGYAMYALDHTVDFLYRNDLGWISIGAGTLETENDKISSEWNAINRAIHRANIAIEGAESYRKMAPVSEEEQLDALEGEALFLRALFWWHMMSLYAEPDPEGVGIPILKHSAGDILSARVKRENTRSCYESIVETLQQAIPLLERQTDKFHADQWAAQGLLAKTLLFMGETEEAREVLETILADSGKRLVTFSQLHDMYNGDMTFEHPSESLFEVENALFNANVNTYGSGWICGSALSRWFSHFYIREDGVRENCDFCNQYCHDRNLTRFGYTTPAPLNYLRESARQPSSEAGYVPFHTEWSGYYLEASYIQEQRAMQHRALSGNALLNDPDPRMFICVLMPYLDSCKAEGGMTWACVAQSAKGEWYQAGSGNDPCTYYGFPLRKYQFLEGKQIKDGGDCTGENVYFMRLSEVYLMYAMVLADQGEEEKALEYINKVHRRAYGCAPDKPSDWDYRTLSDRTRTADPEDHLAYDPLKYEVFMEFFGEFRWWEYVRFWQIGPEEASFYKTLRGPGDAGITQIEFPDRHYTQPIYHTEIEANPLLVQTPGYE